MTCRSKIGDMFQVRSGDIHATEKELEYGNIPLVSCGDINHGLVGYFDVPLEFQYEDSITVAYNGQPLTAKYRPYLFGAKDDIGILEPLENMSHRVLLYVAAVLNSRRWRYSYGRKCFKKKLESVEIDLPVHDDAMDSLFKNVVMDKRPRVSQQNGTTQINQLQWKEFRLDEIFSLDRSNFHSLKVLSSGDVATVSRTEADNGVIGYYEKSEGEILHPPGLITVSTVSGDAFVQMAQFQATDNVIVCVPRFPIQKESAYFIAAMINRQKWRYSYGRQPYKGKLSKLSISLPVVNGKINEDIIKKIVEQNPYWCFLSEAG